MSTNASDARPRAANSTYFAGYFLGRPAEMWRKAIRDSRRRDGRPTQR